MARMSSTLTLGRPARAARAFAATIKDCPAGPRAPRDPLRHVLRAGFLATPGRADQVHRVVDAIVGDRHASDHLLEGGDPLARNQRRDLFQVDARGQAVDPPLLVRRRVVDEDLEQEPVELGLGQGIRALLLDRILGRQHEERVRQTVLVPARGHLPFLHGLQERSLGLRGSSVDLVGEHEVGEERPRHEPQFPRPGGPVLVQDLGAGNIAGHEVGRELDPAEFQGQGLCQRVDHERLGQPGHPFQNAVAACEDGDQELVNHFVLADDLPGHLSANLAVYGPQLCQFGQVGLGYGRCTQGRVSLLETSPLEHGKILERKLEDDHGDRRAVHLADVVAVP